MLSSCQPGAILWISDVFGDCIYNVRDLVGFSCGITSICCWMVAQIPQLYKNYKTKHAEALSPWFLASWLLGDTCNLLGALLKGDQLPTVVFTAQYFITVDCVMMVQYIYYTSLQRRRERMQASRRHRHHHHHHHHRRRHDSTGMQQHQSGSGEQQPGGSAEQAWAGSGGDREGRGPHAAADGRDAAASVAASAAAAHECCDSSGEIKPGGVLLGGSSSRAVPAADVSFRPQRVLACLGTLLVVAHLQQPQPDEAGQRGLGGRRLLAAGVLAAGSGGTGLLAHMPLWAYTAGTVLGYCSSVFYLTSRASQIYRNWQRQSVEGLAISMFMCAIAANSLYGASILIRSATWPELRSSLPWLIGSLGTVALDVTIFAQARLFGAAAAQKQHPSDEDEPLIAAP